MTITTKSAIITHGEDGEANIWLKKPVKCRCGRMAYFVINRGGRTRCLDCDIKSKK